MANFPALLCDWVTTLLPPKPAFCNCFCHCPLVLPSSPQSAFYSGCPPFVPAAFTSCPKSQVPWSDALNLGTESQRQHDHEQPVGCCPLECFPGAFEIILTMETLETSPLLGDILTAFHWQPFLCKQNPAITQSPTSKLFHFIEG